MHISGEDVPHALVNFLAAVHTFPFLWHRHFGIWRIPRPPDAPKRGRSME